MVSDSPRVSGETFTGSFGTAMSWAAGIVGLEAGP
jgi:hypothetical protein